MFVLRRVDSHTSTDGQVQRAQYFTEVYSIVRVNCTDMSSSMSLGRLRLHVYMSRNIHNFGVLGLVGSWYSVCV